MAINLGSALVYLGANLTGLKDNLNTAEGETTSWAKRVGDSVLGLISGVVVGGVTAAAGAVTAIGGIALNTASDIDAAVKKSMSQLGSQAADQAKLSETISQVYAQNWGDSIEDVGEAVTITTQQMDRFGEMTSEELQAATAHAIALRDAFGKDINETTAAANTLMEEFGITSEEAFTFLQSGFQNGLNSSDDFLDTINEYAVQFKDGGASASEFFSVLDTGLRGGMLGTDKAADLFKEFRLRIQDGSTLTADSLAAIGLSADELVAGLNDGSIDIMDAFIRVNGALARTESRTTAFNAGVGLMGSQFEDLGESAVDAIDPLSLTMNDIAQLTSDINVRYNTWGSLIEGMKRRVQVGLAPLGNILLDIGNRFMPLINRGFEFFQGKLEGAVGVIQTFADYLQYAAEDGDWLNDMLTHLPGSLQPVAKFIGEIVGRLSEGEGPLEAFRNTLADFIPPETMSRIDDLSQKVGDFVNAVINFVSNHAEALKTALLAIGGILIAMSIGSAIGDIAKSLTSLATPLGVVTALLGLFIVAWENNWLGIRDRAVEAWEVLEPALKDFSGWFQRDGRRILPIITGIAVALGAFSIITTVVGWITALGAALTAAGGAITAAGGGLAGLVALLGGPVTLVIAAVAAAIGLFAAAWQGNWFGIRDTLTAVWEENIKPALNDLANWFNAVIIPALQNLYNQWVTVVWPAIQAAISTAWNDYIKPALEAIGKYITEVLIPTAEKLYKMWVEQVWPAIQSITQNVGKIITAILAEINRWINDNLIPILQALYKTWVEEVWPPIQKKLEEVWAIIQPILKELQEWFDVKVQQALKTARDVWNEVMDAMGKKVADVGQPIREFFDRIMEFADWLQKQVFDFEFHIPDLPDWAVPGSPLPIHTAWKQFGQEMNAMRIAPKVDLSGALAGAVGGGGTSVTFGDVNVTPPAGAKSPASYGDATKDGLRRFMKSKGVLK